MDPNEHWGTALADAMAKAEIRAREEGRQQGYREGVEAAIREMRAAGLSEAAAIVRQLRSLTRGGTKGEG